MCRSWSLATENEVPRYAQRRNRPASSLRERPPASAFIVTATSGATWSGRGRAPAWIGNAKDRSRFLIGGATAADRTLVVKKAAAKKATTAKKAAAKKSASGKVSAINATLKKATRKSESVSAAVTAAQTGSAPTT
ncbi:H-NS family nucleoid-associated regulatory protein [Paraburkholderia strydomiana]|uniref:H-NS family nucleoid-associated regulatory protein n=1 Tax=Paraburkholderia strydomiana TaxID=1245417 RepID=UPI0038BC9E98